MGRGNVRVTGLYEGLYYIDNDYYQVFRRTDTFADDEEGMYRLLADLSTDELNSDDWVYDAESSSCELDFILEGFIDFRSMPVLHGRRKTPGWHIRITERELFSKVTSFTSVRRTTNGQRLLS